MKWWNLMPWSSFSECWGLSRLFHSPFTFIKRLFSSLFSAIRVLYLHIWDYWYFFRQSWFQLMLHPVQHFSWSTLLSVQPRGIWGDPTREHASFWGWRQNILHLKGSPEEWEEADYAGSCWASSFPSTLASDKVLTSLCLSFLICTVGILFIL